MYVLEFYAFCSSKIVKILEHANDSTFGYRVCVWRLVTNVYCKTMNKLPSGNERLTLPGVGVWNADFRQHMVHQSSLCYEDLTQCRFVVSSTSVRRARVINWKSECIVCVFAFYMSKFIPHKEHPRSALIFCFHFKKNCCPITQITSKSLWWICSIAIYV